MVRAIKAEMSRRGDPLAQTQWTPKMIKAFVRWQLAMLQAGKLRASSLGGFAYKLPTAKSGSGRPAELPEPVKAFLRSGQPEA